MAKNISFTLVACMHIDNYHNLEYIKYTIFCKKFRSNEIHRAIELHVLSEFF